MATDVISGGNIEPRALEDEMRNAYLDYAMSVIVGRALPDVRDGLKPVHRRVLFAMNESASARPALRQVRAHRRRGDGQLPPARRRVDLRHARADGAGLLDALHARRRPGQLRLDRRRPAGGHALHRGAARRASPWRCCATSTWTRSTSSPTTTAASRSRRCCRRASRTCWSTAAPASPSAWRPTSRRTTSTRSSTATVAFIDNPAITLDGLMKHIQGPDFPTGGIILGRSGIRDAYETGRGRVRVRAKAHIEEIHQGKEAMIVTELPYMVKKGGDNGLITKIAELVAREEDPRDLRPARRVRPQRHAAGDRAQARRRSPRSC